MKFFRKEGFTVERCVEDQIQQIYPSLSKGERKVADYVRENMSAVLRMTIRELKDAVGVSEPTVFRFCQAMGYSGFKDFKISMAQGYSSYNEYFFHTDAENNATELQALIRKTLYSESHVIETTMRFLDETLLEAASRQLIASRRICLFGVGTSFTICNDAQRKLTRLGLSVWTYNEFHSSMMLISTMNENDVVFCISHSGITPETGEILKIAHAKGIHTILMTSFPNTPMCKYAQIILRTYGQEVSTNRTAMTSRIGQLAVVDALYVTLVHLMGEDVVNFMEQTVRDTYQR